MAKRQNVLVVGAGALGQVYARHLVMAGAAVTFLVKPKHEAATRAGYWMLPRRTFDQGVAQRFAEFAVETSMAELHARRWDAVWLAVRAPDLQGDWLAALADAVGGATLVVLQPGLEQRDQVLAHFDEAQVVFGVPAIVSYPAPLHPDDPTEHLPGPGTAYWLPPLATTMLSGRRAPAMAQLLTAGQMPASVVDDAIVAGVVPTSALITVIAALELAGWDLDALATSRWLPLAVEAARAAMVAGARRFGSPAPLARRLLHPALLRLGLRLLPRLAPFDVEAYLRLHFTKTGGQTRALLDQMIAHGDEVAPLRELRAALPRAPSDGEG